MIKVKKVYLIKLKIYLNRGVIMTLRDFLRRVKLGDLDKMLIWSDGYGWSNVDIEMDECTIKILPDKSNSPFSSDK